MRADGETKRALIYSTALTLFRDKGFEATTMRDIAKVAQISLGSAYHYFPSKVAIVFAYYEEVQSTHERRADKEMAGASDLRAKLAAVFETKLELVRRDRALMGAIAASIVTPKDSMSAFSPESAGFRTRGIALFTRALDDLDLAAEDARTLGLLLWTAHLGMLLFLVHDDSRGQRRTRELTARVLDSMVPLLQLATTPLVAGVIRMVRQLLEESGLWVEDPGASQGVDRSPEAG